MRHATRVKDGKAHTYWRLVRSVRVGRKVVQQTVAHLGELDAEGRARARALARAITGDREQADLFTTPESPPEPVRVRLDRVRLERGRTFSNTREWKWIFRLSAPPKRWIAVTAPHRPATTSCSAACCRSHANTVRRKTRSTRVRAASNASW